MKLILNDNTLATFLEAAEDTASELVKNNPPALRLAREVDELIRSQVWGPDVDIPPVASLLAITSYHSFLASIRVALSGQVFAIFPLIRHSLECACYSYVVAKNASLAKVWLHRHSGPAELKACRNEFGNAVSSVAVSIKDIHAELGTLVSDLYQSSIDLGAHPNVDSILTSLTIDDTEPVVRVTLDCLCNEDDDNIQAALITCAETGIICAFVTALAAKHHPLIDPQFTALGAIYRRVHETIDEVKAALTTT